MLLRFLTSLKIPMIATLRDSQNFVYAAERGLGICELPAHKIRDDIVQMDAIVSWLQKRRAATTAAQAQEERDALIARAAYRRAERRGFKGGDPLTDWLEAEREVDAGERR